MSRWLLMLISALALTGCGYNDFQRFDEQTKSAWSEVLNQYQRRADLVPNIVATVKGEAAFEQETLTKVIEARAKATSIQVSPETLNNPAAFQKFQAVQGELGSALSRLMVVSERYPTLKANEGFRDLRVQLEGTENRITVARNRYIQSVQAYNVLARSFPSNLTAMVFHYTPKPAFAVQNELLPLRPWLISTRNKGPAVLITRSLAGLVSAVVCWLFLTLAPAFAQQAVPLLSAHVIDTTQTLSADQVQQLDNKLAAFEANRGAQVVVLMVPSTQPEDIASFANRVANTWKIGRKDVGDGLLLIVALKDRAVRIEVAKTLEGAIPDLAAKRIIDQAITPNFRQGHYSEGLEAAVNSLMALISGEALPAPPAKAARTDEAFDWHGLLVLMFFVVPFVAGLARSMLGSKLGTLATGAAVGGLTLLFTSSLVIALLAAVAALVFSMIAPLTVLSGMNRRGPGGWGGGAGGFGGGGFRSGGGGDFGGGGASGKW